MNFCRYLFLFYLNLPLAGHSQLLVEIQPMKLIASKSVIPLTLKNDFTAKIESARAGLFLLDEQGKMVGQATRWVIGGDRGTNGLAPGATNVFYFVITSDKPITSTNLTARISFSKVVVEGGKSIDISKGVVITEAKPQKPPAKVDAK